MNRVYIVEQKIRDDRRGDLGPSLFSYPVSAHPTRKSATAEARRRTSGSQIYTYRVRGRSLKVLP